MRMEIRKEAWKSIMPPFRFLFVHGSARGGLGCKHFPG